MNAVVEARKLDPQVQSIRQEIANMGSEFAAVLPANVRVEEFRRVVLNAIQENPELIEADRQTFFRACLDCARDGLVPDGKEAYFDIRSTKVKVRGQGDVWVKKVVYMPMVRGFYKRAVGKTLKDWRADVVCEHDRFKLVKGDEESFIHEPLVFGERGRILGAYSIAVRMDGTISREFISYADCMKAKEKSSSAHSPSSPWNVWEDRMCIKTVVKRHAPRLNIGQEVDDLVDRDNGIVRDALEAPAKPAAAAGRRATEGLQSMAQTREAPRLTAQEPQEDPETQNPTQAAREPQQQPVTSSRGRGRPSNAEKEAAARASQEALQEQAQKSAQRAAPPAEPRASEKSPPPSDTSQQEAGRRGTTTPRNGGATTASRSRAEPERGSHISGDPVDDIQDEQGDGDQDEQTPTQRAWDQGYAAFRAELDRKAPREFNQASRYEELTAWFDGYDEAVDDEERRAQQEADGVVDRAYA